MRDEVLGVRFSQFPDLPAAVWNHLCSVYRDSFKDMAGAVNKAYAAGIEGGLAKLLDETIPGQVLKVGRECMEGVLGEERGFMGTRIQCHLCPEEAGYHEDVAKSLVTRLGSVPTRRSYYVCPNGHTFYPQDILLGVDGEHRILPSVQENLAFLTAHMAYSKAVDTLERLTGIDLSAQTAERVTATVAGVIEQYQEMERKEAFAAEEPKFPAPMEVFPKDVGIVAADGGFLRIRHQEEQSEFKAAVLGTMEPVPGVPLLHPETGEKRSLPPMKDKLYLAHLEKVDNFFEHLTVEFFRRGLHRCSVLQFLADGADCYWNRFPDLVQPGQEVIQTLDFYHGMDYVRDAAEAIFGKSRPTTPDTKSPADTDICASATALKQPSPSPRCVDSSQDRPTGKERRIPKPEQMTKPKEGTPARAWYDTMGGHLLEGRLDDFFRQLKQHQPTTTMGEEKDPVTTAVHYFEVRRHLLTYSECIERGLPIGSGMAEGCVRFVGKDRLDRPGSKWSKPGAEGILQLRSLDASNRWPAFFGTAAADRLKRYQQMKDTWHKKAA
jgi:hypothetical protein